MLLNGRNFFKSASITKNSAILMVHPVISDHLNYYLVEGFNYKACELLPDNIATELTFIAYTSFLGQNTVTSEIMIVGDILEMEGEDS